MFNFNVWRTKLSTTRHEDFNTNSNIPSPLPITLVFSL